MEISIEKLKQLRTDRGWTQEHLALVASLSYRTVQRIEKEGRCSLESLMSLSQAFSIEPSDLKRQLDENITSLFDLVFILDGEGRYKSIKAKAPNLLFKPQSDVIGKLISEVLPSEISDFFMHAVDRLKSGEKIVEYEYSLKVIDGPNYFKALITQVERDSFLAVVEEQTDKVKALKQLRANEALLTEVGDVMKIGGWDIDLLTWEINWTKQVKDIYEVDSIPTIEEGIAFYAPEARPVIKDAFYDLIQKGISYNLELPFITAKGNHLMVRVIGTPHYENGKITRASGIIQDITDINISRLA